VLAEHDRLSAERAAFLAARLIANDLAGLGITVDCAPVADLRWAGAHDVIGDRAYAGDPGTVAVLATAACDGLLAGGVTPVFKHVPGHGRARSDSHHELPRIEADLDSLQRTDFAPFRELAARHGHSSWAMTAHVVVAAVDEAPVTLSKRALDTIVRGHIGFDGLILSDDLSMRALSGGFRERTAAALAAGCDLVLHCNGDAAEMAAVAEALPELSSAAQVRLDRAEGVRRSRALPCDPGLLQAEFDALLRQGARSST
jgi:beta-N-acetylhexosaminidase